MSKNDRVSIQLVKLWMQLLGCDPFGLAFGARSKLCCIVIQARPSKRLLATLAAANVSIHLLVKVAMHLIIIVFRPKMYVGNTLEHSVVMKEEISYKDKNCIFIRLLTCLFSLLIWVFYHVSVQGLTLIDSSCCNGTHWFEASILVSLSWLQKKTDIFIDGETNLSSSRVRKTDVIWAHWLIN